MNQAEKQIERLQRLLEGQRIQNQRLVAENKGHTAHIEKLRQIIEDLQIAKSQYSFSSLLQHQNPLTNQSKTIQFENIIKGQSYQIAYYQETNQSMRVELTAQQTKITELNCLINEKDLKIEKLNLKIDELSQIEAIMKTQVETLGKKVQNLFISKQELIKEKAGLVRSLKNETSQHQRKLIEISEGVQAFKDFITLKQSQRDINPSKNQQKDEQIIMKLQLDELQERNEEILRLRSICNGTKVSMEEAHLKNTIRHLRGQLGRYSKMTKQVLERAIFAQSLIKQYEESVQVCKKELESLVQLKQQNSNLKNKIEVLQFQVEGLNNQIQNEKKSIKEKNSIMVGLLLQNQCYHTMMHENYGQGVYNNFISKNKAAYLSRLEERKKTEKWTNIDELIQVNQNMRRKLKLI